MAQAALSGGTGGVALTPSRQAKADRLLRRLRFDGTTDLLEPHLREGERLLEALVLEVATTAGECGPGSASVMHSCAAQKALAMFYFELAQKEPDPKDSIRIARFAADLMDRSRANYCAALDLAVRIARTKPVGGADPLADAQAIVDAKPEPDE